MRSEREVHVIKVTNDWRVKKILNINHIKRFLVKEYIWMEIVWELMKWCSCSSCPFPLDLNFLSVSGNGKLTKMNCINLLFSNFPSENWTQSSLSFWLKKKLCSREAITGKTEALLESSAFEPTQKQLEAEFILLSTYSRFAVEWQRCWFLCRSTNIKRTNASEVSNDNFVVERLLSFFICFSYRSSQSENNDRWKKCSYYLRMVTKHSWKYKTNYEMIRKFKTRRKVEKEIVNLNSINIIVCKKKVQ